VPKGATGAVIKTNATTRSAEPTARALPPGPRHPAVPRSARVAADYLRSLIFDGILRQGDRVPIDDVALQLGVSRQPVREAILELENDGLVMTKPKYGTFVGTINAQIVREHHTVYGLLEGYAVRQVTDCQEPAVLEELHRLAKHAAEAVGRDQVVEDTRRFLHVIDTAGSGERLRTLFRQINRFVPPVYLAEHVPGAQILISGAIAPIMQAIDAGDADAAAAAVEHLWHQSGELLIAHFQATGVFDSQA
jgi:DNA-binding GntR family transcriptional regulator